MRRDVDEDALSPKASLRMRPRHFFSKQFDMEIVDDYSKEEADRDSAGQSKWLNRLIQMNLLLMILLIGVPLLLYCIGMSAK
ncbi:hypothetical protein [Sphingomonas aerolata]|uniref:hypothetical protein n=1 Tax=Sphingomonas aerolata TaxID=185951 RepID=UPI002FE427EB